MKRIAVLTGAGISAESGLKSFRDSGGLGEDYDIMKVASPEGWQVDPELVIDFYNKRRRQLMGVSPNEAHKILAELESDFIVDIVTQNVDDLHERAGSTSILHLHGELIKVRSTEFPNLIYEWKGDLSITDRCENGAPLRPHVVWFGEPVPAIEQAIPIIQNAEVLLIIGTSLQVYPAAGLIDLFPSDKPAYYIDPAPLDYRVRPLRHIMKSASEGLRIILPEILSIK